jgi:hypothetical protein
VSPNGKWRLTITDDGIAMEGFQFGGIRLNNNGVEIVGPGGLNRILIKPNNEMHFLSAQGTGLSLVNGGAVLYGKDNSSVDLGATIGGAALRGPNNGGGLQFTNTEGTLFGYGNVFSIGRNQDNDPQMDLSSRVIQMTGAQIGVGGFCHPIPRANVDLVHNPFQSGGYEWGTITEGSPIASTC